MTWVFHLFAPIVKHPGAIITKKRTLANEFELRFAGFQFEAIKSSTHTSPAVVRVSGFENLEKPSFTYIAQARPSPAENISSEGVLIRSNEMRFAE